MNKIIEINNIKKLSNEELRIELENEIGAYLETGGRGLCLISEAVERLKGMETYLRLIEKRSKEVWLRQWLGRKSFRWLFRSNIS